MKDLNNHIDEFFKNSIENADFQPPVDLWNGVSQSWDQFVQSGHQESLNNQLGSDKISDTADHNLISDAQHVGPSGSVSSQNTIVSVKNSSNFFGVAKMSGYAKLIFGLLGTAIVAAGGYYLIENASPEKKNQKYGTRNTESVMVIENGSGNGNSYKENILDVNSQEVIGSKIGQSIDGHLDTKVDTQFSVANDRKTHGVSEPLFLENLGTQNQYKNSGNPRDFMVSDFSNLAENSISNSFKHDIELIQNRIHVEQNEVKVNVRIDGLSGINAVVKSVIIGKSKMINPKEDIKFIRSDLQGWSFPVEGEVLDFQYNLYLKEVKTVTVKVTVRFLGNVEKDVVVEKQIELKPWIAGGKEIIPNIFTPNGDGFNDEYYVKIKEPESFEMTITSAERPDLGTVFVTESLSERWNGKKGELKCPDGKYWVLLHMYYHTLDRQGEWVYQVSVERVLIELNSN